MDILNDNWSEDVETKKMAKYNGLINQKPWRPSLIMAGFTDHNLERSHLPYSLPCLSHFGLAVHTQRMKMIMPQQIIDSGGHL